MKSQAGVLVHINNSRRAVYGYDQRVEIFGSKGMLLSNNQTPTSVEKFNKSGTFIRDPIYNFFIERFRFPDFVSPDFVCGKRNLENEIWKTKSFNFFKFL